MTERMSNEEINSLLAEDACPNEECGCPTCQVCRDLIDARGRIAELERERDEARLAIIWFDALIVDEVPVEDERPYPATIEAQVIAARAEEER